ncbi:ParB/RepB/Spo0J family partition protein [Butyrivibrio sp. INlla14]|uniref:ParB/RepB/Spo0J family partition protein n=1 Tax=Butyrivibrio sp. INlla14 TaxID=1520808 RepID=UPI0008768A90|nr:ParB/RepB/Spo0J family partition protein [Butyrivibrio sp. INlla14]SCY30577.1 ParB-like nuclease domain-containing protein [Butyrivibrio sp. INlla14]
MAMTNSEFKEYLKNELEKEVGMYVPVNSSRLQRLFYLNTPCTNLHPNPDDEFSFPDVGPSYRIMSDYQRAYLDSMARGLKPAMEPLIVIRTHPSGFMLINGHHRWGAAMMAGVKKVPIKVVNMMLEEEIKDILKHSTHEKRVTLDLDEVVFRSNSDVLIEKKPALALGSQASRRMRLGIPALFRFLKKNGYDIWVFSANYYSIDDIRKFFRKYTVHVDGIITATAKKEVYNTEAAKNMKELITNKYKETVHIANDSLLITHGKGEEFKDFELDPDDEGWAREIITILSSEG